MIHVEHKMVHTHPPRIDPYDIHVYQTYVTKAKYATSLSGTCIMFLE